MAIISGFPGIKQRYYLQPPWNYMTVGVGGNYYGYFVVPGYGNGGWRKIEIDYQDREKLIEITEDEMRKRLTAIQDGRV
jgi:hypothetical protein